MAHRSGCSARARDRAHGKRLSRRLPAMLPPARRLSPLTGPFLEHLYIQREGRRVDENRDRGRATDIRIAESSRSLSRLR
jgi:hypothetical protein